MTSPSYITCMMCWRGTGYEATTFFGGGLASRGNVAAAEAAAVKRSSFVLLI